MSDTSSLHLPVASSAMIQTDSSKLFPDDRRALEQAVRALEHTNLATRLATLVGRQLGSLSRFLPMGVSGLVNRAAEKAIGAALSVALGSLQKQKKPMRNSRLVHRAMAAASGAAGGLFGLSSLAVELPVSTVIILRAIADIARDEGEDLTDPAVALACLEVFALGAHEAGDDFTDSGYFATRGLLAKTVSEASRYAVQRGAADGAAPAMIRLVSQIGARFGIVVSEKLAAQAVPIVGAAGGAAVNYAFVEHFQSIAFGHFTVRRLEKVYGTDVVQAEYRKLHSEYMLTAAA
ncbi:EcsC family protein [Beijerinckia sp. L45]|uniref:EcsC family protein n=1 Tax=Beijerinckia sp. L45 TaxID=1641855 RepID=UPI001FED2B75|nr:EcsC family protein [Beijerinckia sp. L45]